MRINKYIASCGICSRRKAEEYILDGKIKINGKIVKDFATNITENDEVFFENKKISLEEEKIYIMLNKPVGYVTTNNEQFNRKSTNELIHENKRVFPIGRLDMYTEGLLLLTNDGEFSNKMMHPKNNVYKKYIVDVDRKITDEDIFKLESGVDIGGYITAPAKARVLNNKKLEIVISEGKNRQVRKMCEAVSLKVIKLKRVQIGNLKLGDLPVGKYKILKKEEIKKI